MPDKVEIDARQLQAYSKLLGRRAAQFPRITQREVGKWMKKQRNVLKSTPYPAKRSGQTYVRTGNLANSWSVAKRRGAWEIKNSRPYSGYVVGERQAWMHKNRWWKAINVLRKGLADLRKNIANEIAKQVTK